MVGGHESRVGDVGGVQQMQSRAPARGCCIASNRMCGGWLWAAATLGAGAVRRGHGAARIECAHGWPHGSRVVHAGVWGLNVQLKVWRPASRDAPCRGLRRGCRCGEAQGMERRASCNGSWVEKSSQGERAALG